MKIPTTAPVDKAQQGPLQISAVLSSNLGKSGLATPKYESAKIHSNFELRSSLTCECL